MTIRVRRFPVVVSLAVAAGALAACSSSPPPDAALEQARSTYNRVAADPEVADHASLELRQAKDSLDQADALWRDGRDQKDIDYRAYLATRQAQIAEQTARLKAAEDQTRNSGGSGAQTAQLQARTAQAQADADQAQARARQAEQRADALQQEIAALHAKQEGGGYVLTLGDILFNTGSPELKPGATPELDQLAEFLQHHPDRTIMVQGFTDNTGSAEVNRRLSEQRAEAVKDALVVRGIDGARIRTRGYGDAMPVASNQNAGGRQLNRRVQVVISDPNGRLPAIAG